MENKYLNKLQAVTEYASLGVVLTAVITVIILSFWVFSAPSPPGLQKHEYKIAIHLDSTFKSAQNDSLLVLVQTELNGLSIKTSNDVNTLMENQRQNHEAFMEAENRQNKFITYASALIAIVAALGGFFGFKSITDIKQSITEKAELTAQQMAREVSERILEKSIKTQIESIAQANYEKEFLRLIESYEERLNDLKSKLDECCERHIPPNDEIDPQITIEFQANPIPGANASTTFNDDQL